MDWQTWLALIFFFAVIIYTLWRMMDNSYRRAYWKGASDMNKRIKENSQNSSEVSEK